MQHDGAGAEGSTGGTRADGRTLEELRAHFCATIGGLTRASGSAVLQLGSTHVAVAVHGPKPADGRAALADTGQVIATVEFAAFAGAPPKPLARGPDLAKQQAEQFVTEALSAAILLDRCPKSLIEVHCFVLECGGSEVPALAMAAGLAVADAQIDMRCTLSAACVVSLARNVLVDPTAAEQARAERSVLVAMDASKRRIAHVAIGGNFGAAELRDALELAEQSCEFYEAKLAAAARARHAALAAA